MKSRLAFLPILLCMTFLSRMIFLSFFAINTPVMSHHQALRSKRKIDVCETKIGKLISVDENKETNEAYCMGKRPLLKAVISNRLKLTINFLYALVANNFIEQASRSFAVVKSHADNLFPGSTQKKFIALSVFRI